MPSLPTKPCALSPPCAIPATALPTGSKAGLVSNFLPRGVGMPRTEKRHTEVATVALAPAKPSRIMALQAGHGGHFRQGAFGGSG